MSQKKTKTQKFEAELEKLINKYGYQRGHLSADGSAGGCQISIKADLGFVCAMNLIQRKYIDDCISKD